MYTCEEERSDFRNAVYEGTQDSGKFKKKTKFFFCRLQVGSTEGIGLKENFVSSVWLHIQVSDQLHALSDLTHGIQPPPHYLRKRVYDPMSRPSCGDKRPSETIQSIVKNQAPDF